MKKNILHRCLIPEFIINYLTIEALEDGLTASLSINACEYCVDGDDNWRSLSASTTTESINTGHTLSFRGNLTPNSSNGIGTFTISKKCNLKGNCMSMLFGDNAADNFSLSGKNYAFYKLFSNCSNIVTVSSNFLPATILTLGCYSSMFHSCKSLINAPELLAPKLVQECYSDIFCNCINLKYVKMVASEKGWLSLNKWLYNVSSTGTIIKHPLLDLPISTSENAWAGIPSGWTVVNDGEE